MPDPWLERWEVFETIGEGGQGVARRALSRNDGTVGVLKLLRKQQDAERRGRMHREAEALKTLAHPGIPKLLDSNTSDFAGTSKLFIVLEFIEGPTLEKLVETGPLAFEDAVRLTLRLVEIVAYCHDRSFGHRDIKPDNILMRNGDRGEPVLIDFGLAFNVEEASGGTGSEQQLGNRFLALPELTTPGSEKRDRRADLASCCGVLYYVLSGYQPMTLRDDNNKAPHERRDFAHVLESLPDRTRTMINLVFGRGFTYSRDDRYQDASELQRDLEALLVVPTYPEGSERVRSAIEKAQLINREAAMSREKRERELGDALRTFIGAICNAVDEQVAARVARGIPIRKEPVDPTEWSAIAGRVLERRKANIFHYRCKAPGTAGFQVYFQLQPSEYESDATVSVRLFTESSLAVREAYYLLRPGGRWTRVGRPPEEVSGTDLIDDSLTLIDDEELWSVPEERRR